ncbi:PqqD family protein [Gulosibacter molinativorax]|uniref:PqqD family protein n=1 Tax=Gulosibacter molinativorax TaxID=256821 RepID=A0ABT7C7S9_9MICO|nr:PqqD family protein [Gulosibacter molinativorax]QUY63664.1 Hypotetical protein [Gulosibacter molinativorax]
MLEGSAAVIWRTLGATPRTEEDIIAEVAKAFAQSPLALGSDVRAFLRDLDAQGLAKRTN